MDARTPARLAGPEDSAQMDDERKQRLIDSATVSLPSILASESHVHICGPQRAAKLDLFSP